MTAPYRLLGLGAILIGVALRLRNYLDNRPLWIDDARLALNVGTRSLGGLTRVLDYNQAAPIPFLWAEWVVTRAAGYSEYALRAVPLACSVLLLPILWLVGRRTVGEREAVLATLIAALSVYLIAYGSAVKPYGLDALVTVCLLGLTVRTLDNPAARRWQTLALGGALALVASYPSVFVLVGVVAALMVDPRIRADARNRRRMLVLAAAWLATFGVKYVAVDRLTAADPYLRWFWETTFLTPGLPHFARRLANNAREAFVLPFYFYNDASGAREKLLAMLAIVLCGFATLVRRRAWALLALLGVPYAAVLLAVVAGRYPGSARLLLFLSPILFLVCAAGLMAGLEAALAALARVFHPPMSRSHGIAYGMLVVALLAWRLPPALRYVRTAPAGDIRRVVRYTENAPDRDPLYVDAIAVPTWFFYSTDWSAPDRARLAWIARQAMAGGPAFENLALRGRPVQLGEGSDLVDWLGGRREVIGMAAGVGSPTGSWDRRPAADPGWAANEARRLREASDTAAWIVSADASTQRTTLGDLLAQLERQGGRVVSVSANEGAVLYRVHFAPRNRHERSLSHNNNIFNRTPCIN